MGMRVLKGEALAVGCAQVALPVLFQLSQTSKLLSLVVHFRTYHPFEIYICRLLRNNKS